MVAGDDQMGSDLIADTQSGSVELNNKRSEDRYDVGYGKPPKTTRFVKGRSGNPRGRPRKQARARGNSTGADEPTKAMILEEAYRPVAVREGDNVIQLPAIQAARSFEIYL